MNALNNLILEQAFYHSLFKIQLDLNKEELKALLDSHLSSNQAESNKLGLIADSVSEWARNLFKRKNK